MRYVVFTCFMFAVIIFCKGESINSSSDREFLVVGYLLTYNVKQVDDSIAGKLTDIIYFSVEPSLDGTIDTSRLKQSDIDYLHSLKQKHGFRLLLAIGGWGRCKNFASVCINDGLRKKLINDLHQLCLKYKFDGIDYDWEFPDNEQQKQAYNKLIVETSQAVKSYGILVTCALSPWQKLSKEAYQALDRVHIMAYDQGKRHSTYNKAVESLNFFMGHGVDRSKLCLGVPFYGRMIEDFGNSMGYNQLVEKYNPKRDVDEVGGYYFNGPDTMQKKIRYCCENNIGGVMIWEISQDTSDETSLLSEISRECERMEKVGEK